MTDRLATDLPRVPHRTWLAFLICYAALQVWLIGRLPLEQDELYTLLESRDLFATTLKPGIDARPLYYLLQHPLLELVGTDTVALRILPMVFGLAGLWLTAALAYQVTRSANAATIAMCLAALSPWFLHTTSFARYWSLAYLCTTGLLLSLLVARDTRRTSAWLQALAFAVAGSLTHPTFLFGAAGYCAAILLCDREGRLGLQLPSRSELLAFWMPWAVIVLTGVLILKLTGSSETIQNFSGRGLAATLRLPPAIVQWITPSVFVAGGLGILWSLTSAHERRWGLTAAAGAAASIGLLAAAATRTNVYADYAVPVLPILTVSAATLIDRIARSGTHVRATAISLTALVIAGQLPSTVSFLIDGMRFDYRPALATARSTDRSAPVMGWPEILMKHYAPDLSHIPYRPTPTGLQQAFDAHGRFWLVLSRREYGYPSIEPDGEVWANTACRRIDRFQRVRFDSRHYEVELLLCDRGPTAVTATSAVPRQ